MTSETLNEAVMQVKQFTETEKLFDPIHSTLLYRRCTCRDASAQDEPLGLHGVITVLIENHVSKTEMEFSNFEGRKNGTPTWRPSFSSVYLPSSCGI
jgi:hypothetical protein